MLEPVLFTLFMAVSLLIVCLLKKLLCTICKPFKRLIDRLEAIPDDEIEILSSEKRTKQAGLSVSYQAESLWDEKCTEQESTRKIHSADDKQNDIAV